MKLDPRPRPIATNDPMIYLELTCINDSFPKRTFSQVTQIVITEETMQIHYNGTSTEVNTRQFKQIAIQQIPPSHAYPGRQFAIDGPTPPPRIKTSRRGKQQPAEQWGEI